LIGVLAACASAPSVTRVDGDALARRLGAPPVDPAHDCAGAVRDNVFPHYPDAALARRTEGWVVVGFDLDGSGRSSNARIVASQPPGVFDDAALTSVMKTTYASGVRRTACQSRITFALKAP
ncbi:MAG: TonB family protein, partial [Proteobacteria bacterium]|nr:TonB family protein [Pseudomonadota bacterium]